MNIRILSATLLLISLILVGTSLPLRAQVQEEVLFSVGQKQVEKKEFLYLLTKGKGLGNASGSFSREEFEENFDLFLKFKLRVIEAEALGLDTLEEFKLEFDSFKESLIFPFLIKNSVQEGEVSKVYGRMQEIVRASHILFQIPYNASTEDTLTVLKLALQVKSEIENGGDINELAVKYSDDPSAKINKGDLGYFTSLQMVPQFEEAAFGLPIGTVSDPVLTDFGYHILQVKDRQPNPGEVSVSHILVRFDSENLAQEESARRKVGDIYAEIQKETTLWEEIVKSYSEDPATKDIGGKLPWFGIGTMIPEFEVAAFSLTEVGEISPPLKTPYGYHILRLEGKRELPSFEELEQSIKSKLFRQSKSNLIQSQVEAIQKARFGFKENESTIQQLATELNSVPFENIGATLASKGWAGAELFVLKDISYSATTLWEFMKTQAILPQPNQATFDGWYTFFVSQKLAETEVKDLEENNKEYQLLLKEYRDGILFFSLNNQEVWQKGINDSIGQKAYFQSNLQNYQWKKRVQASLIKVEDNSKLESARKYLQFKNLEASTLSGFEAAFPEGFSIESGNFEYEDHPLLSFVDLNKPYQELSQEGNTYLILLGKTSPAGPRLFEESRGLVIRDYQDFLEKSLVDRLLAKYPVVINSVVKEKAFQDLNQ
ncbi:MAG: peptidylprolyl isomerase [Bacteroidota bacterium]|jgi:peptidyl-prolyl cis-trans isomerase SurA|nr:peptidylprolyl isomerase [Algoriphagus sp.]